MTEVVLINSNKKDSINNVVRNDQEKIDTEKEMKKFARYYLRTKKISYKTWDHLAGGIVGFFEGVSSGALTGVNVSGAGGWVAGLVGQTFGAIAGCMAGSVSGCVIGLINGREKIQSTFSHYREHFGTTTKKRNKGTIVAYE